jgi:RNA polymerase sigma factor (sigma-70 family)
VGNPQAGQQLVSDADLITAIRAGDMDAYGELYQRHVTAAQSLARQLVRGPAEVDDVVAETFSKVLDLMRRGGGPQDAFRPYLLTAVRRVAYDRHRGERKNVVTDEIEAYDPGQPFIDPAVAGLERSLIAKAFLSLPERWRAVLWHTEIEGAKPADVAPLLGLTANGVAALAYRAREGLRQAYLQMHLSGVTRQECRPVVDKLGAFVRGGLSAREAKVVSDHLDGCSDCRAVYAELADVNVGLRGIVAPIFLGPVAAAYIAATAAKGGAVAWIGGRLLWIRHAPKQQQAAMAGGIAAAAAAIAVALALAGHGMPVPPKHHVAAAPPPASPHPVAAAPPPRRHAPPAPPAVVPVQVHVAPAKHPPKPTRTPAPKRTPPKTPPPTPPPPPPPPPVTLITHVDPVGALLRGSTGMLTFTVANTGKAAAKDLSASIKLPPGVSFLSGGGMGMAAPMASSAPGGWNCAATTAGARCTHGPLGPGQTTATYLQVAVSPTAAIGVPPTISVTGGGRSTHATGGSGVVTQGLPARFAADGRLDTIVAGNTLPPCWYWNFGWHSPASSAPISVPGPVLWAGLYWAGDGSPSQTAIDLRGPGGSFQTVGADSVGSADLYGFPTYQAYANVTNLVATYGGGSWQAQVPGNQNDIVADTGWTLVVVAQDPSAPVGEAVVVDGAHAVSAFDPSFHVPLNGLLPAGANAGVQVVTWDGFGYYGDPSLSSYRETLAAEPAVNLSATYRPYLVGVVAATTSADSTQSGPPPYNGWPGNSYDGWRIGVGGSPGWSVEGCGWIGWRPDVPPPGVKSVSGLAGHAHGSAPKTPAPGTTKPGHPGGPGSTRPTPPGGGKPGGSKPGGSAPGGCKPGGSKPGGSKPGGSRPGPGRSRPEPGGPKPCGSKPGGSKPGQDGSLPHGVKPYPCPLCQLLDGLGAGHRIAAQPSPGVRHGVSQRAVPHAGQPGPLAGRLPGTRELGDVGNPHRQLGVRPHARRKQHVVRRPDELGGRGGSCPGHGQAGVDELAERAAAGPGNVHRAGDAAAAAVKHPGRKVAHVGQPDRPAGVAGGEHAAAPCQPGQPPRQPAHIVVRPRDQAGAHDQVPGREGRRHRPLRT